MAIALRNITNYIIRTQTQTYSKVFIIV